jgi:hypothetical protein
VECVSITILTVLERHAAQVEPVRRQPYRSIMAQCAIWRAELRWLPAPRAVSERRYRQSLPKPAVFDRRDRTVTGPSARCVSQQDGRTGLGGRRNFEVGFRYGKTHPKRMAELSAALVRLPVDVIVAGGAGQAQAASSATETIPIVAVGVAIMVELGLVATLAHPGGNVSGLGNPPIQGKELDLLKSVAPSISQVAPVVNFVRIQPWRVS